MRIDRGRPNYATFDDRSSKHALPSFPLASILLPAKTGSSSWLILSLILLAAGLFRWIVSIWAFSGYQKPPMYGDFEAQRHWIELTSHLPVSHWYYHDLQWWGLDYPPLTAYHSWLMGLVGNTLEPKWFALHSSRGLEEHSLKIFMRATVLISDFLLYFPAVITCTKLLGVLESIGSWERSIALSAILMQPATMLIDHGHFQYNVVMLGLVVAAVASCLRSRPAHACMFFVAALGFKQMALFYAPTVFAYLLGICLFPKMNIARFGTISLYTVASFIALFLPFLLGVLYDSERGLAPPEDLQGHPLLRSLPRMLTRQGVHRLLITQLAQAVYRIFPFSRGLFEDKVANIWCAIHSSGLYKLNRANPAVMGRYALLLTTVAIAPSAIIILLRPRKQLLLWSLASTSWGFFLCSYQVHEKNVLLPLLPMTLLLAGKDGLTPSMRAWVGFANALGCWTMFPLLERDDLIIPYVVLTLLWAWLLGLPPISIKAYASETGASTFTTAIHMSTYAAMLGWHIVKAIITPPASMPDIMVVANVCIGTAGFGLCYLWSLWNLWTRSGLLYWSHREKTKTL